MLVNDLTDLLMAENDKMIELETSTEADHWPEGLHDESDLHTEL